MNGNLKRRIEKLEQAVKMSGGDDHRVYSHPNNFAELVMKATMNNEEWQKFLQTRKSKPCPKFWDWVDNMGEELKKNELMKN